MVNGRRMPAFNVEDATLVNMMRRELWTSQGQMGIRTPQGRARDLLISSSMVGMRLPRRVGIAATCHLAPSRLNARVLLLVMRAYLLGNQTADRQPGGVRCSKPGMSRDARCSHDIAWMTAVGGLR